MNVTGVIAEYNPFHNGHAYQIQKAKELSRADYVIVVMSGNFVQRGMPAILDKFTRTAAALKNGADFVFEIPTVFATASAEYFAAAGTALLNALGYVDSVSFGCETPDLPLLSHIADILAKEPDYYKTRLSYYLKSGNSFPVSRQKAITDYCKTENLSFQSALSGTVYGNPSILLGSPNNILAVEYLKSIIRDHLHLRPIPILRKGAGYHDTGLHQKYCSAAAIRRHLLFPSGIDISDFVPENTASHLFASDAAFLTEQDFSAMLYYKLLKCPKQALPRYADCSKELANRIRHSLPDYRGYRNFCELLKKKDVTYSRISRMLLHILLEITDESIAMGKACGFAPYLRLLGFRRDAVNLFTAIRSHAKCPLITKPAKESALLSADSRALFETDVFASDLYYGVLAQKTGRTQKEEYRREMVILPCESRII